MTRRAAQKCGDTNRDARHGSDDQPFHRRAARWTPMGNTQPRPGHQVSFALQSSRVREIAPTRKVIRVAVSRGTRYPTVSDSGLRLGTIFLADSRRAQAYRQRRSEWAEGEDDP